MVIAADRPLGPLPITTASYSGREKGMGSGAECRRFSRATGGRLHGLSALHDIATAAYFRRAGAKQAFRGRGSVAGGQRKFRAGRPGHSYGNFFLTSPLVHVYTCNMKRDAAAHRTPLPL